MSIAALFAITALLLIACETNTATTIASCAFVVGDGSQDHDAKLHRIVFPGQKTNVGNSEKVSYVPCNSRNYIINDGSVVDANGHQVGDRHTLITATTSGGVNITIAARALWTLNEDEKAMRDFYTVCFKYKCAGSDSGGDANFSTEGWNGMLGENFSPAMDAAARKAAIEVDDTIWDKHSPEQYKLLADKMSEAFVDAVRASLGFPEDLFCGSGNSTWSNPDEPGNGKFTCSPVRIEVDDVQAAPVNPNQNTEGQKTQNEQRLQNAIALYGPDAGWWLALLDAIDKCSKSAGVNCIINLGGANAPVLPIPSNSLPAPAPAATPSP